MESEDIDLLRKTFNSKITLSYEWRRKQLLALEKLINDGSEILCASLKLDMNKNEIEGYMSEIASIKTELQTHLDNLSDWMKPENVATDLCNLPGWSRILREPLGVVCIIGTWNYPVLLSLQPLIGCLAAGNCAILRLPEEGTACHTTKALSELIHRYMDNSVVCCIQGDYNATKTLLTHKFDMIFYTGGAYGGKIVAKAAAEHLTPTILELGGKCPCIVTDKCDLNIAAKRVTFGAFLNAGQTCIRPDYVMVHESIAQKFVSLMKQTLIEFYTNNPQKSEFFGRLIHQNAYNRVIKLLQENEAYCIHGGHYNEKNFYVEPTLLDFQRDFRAFSNSSLMQEEIFAPIIPFYYYNDTSQVIHFINKNNKPLALYCFANCQKLVQRIVNETSSGGITVNDCIVHTTNINLPFGGVGYSGMGAYHGKTSFDTFSHKKAILYKTKYLDIPSRYPPYTQMDFTLLKIFLYPYKARTIKVFKYIMIIIFLFGFKLLLPPKEDVKDCIIKIILYI